MTVLLLAQNQTHWSLTTHQNLLPLPTIYKTTFRLIIRTKPDLRTTTTQAQCPLKGFSPIREIKIINRNPPLVTRKLSEINPSLRGIYPKYHSHQTHHCHPWQQHSYTRADYTPANKWVHRSILMDK